MFDSIRDTITRRFRDIKLWVANIPPESNDSGFQAVSFGLFFVYLYGIYEEIIRSIISTAISRLNDTAIDIGQYIYGLYPLIFHSEYDSLFNVGSEHKWERRWDISNKFNKNPKLSLPIDLFPTDGKNLRIRQLESLTTSFGIQGSVLPRQEIGWYVQEMVDNRNNIAHGNNLPKEIGRKYTKQDLLNRCEYISEVCTYLCSIFESYISEKKYIR